MSWLKDTAQTPNSLPDTTADLRTLVTLVGEDAVWRYDERNIDNGTAWVLPGYDDSSWPAGPGLFGADPDAQGRGFIIRTPLQHYYPGQVAFTPTFYFRTHFTFNADLGTSSLLLRVNYDDGVIVYLNGKEAWRSASLTNANPVTHTNLAANHEGVEWETIQLGNTNLQAGDNVVAVELHQTTLTSGDFLMGCILDAGIIRGVPRPTLRIRYLPGETGPALQVALSWTPVAGSLLVDASHPDGIYTPVAGNPQGSYLAPTAGPNRYFQLRER
jgi:hypothetical protein